MASCREHDRRNPPAEDQQCESDKDEGAEAFVARPRVSLVFFDVFLGYTPLNFNGVGIPEIGGGVGMGLLPLDNVLLLAVHLNCAHCDLTSTRDGEYGKGREREIGGEPSFSERCGRVFVRWVIAAVEAPCASQTMICLCGFHS